MNGLSGNEGWVMCSGTLAFQRDWEMDEAITGTLGWREAKSDEIETWALMTMSEVR